MIIFLGFFITRAVVPAYVMLGYWFLLQIVGGLLPRRRIRWGVAFWAHAGGFLAGAVLVLVFDDDRVARHRALALRLTASSGAWRAARPAGYVLPHGRPTSRGMIAPSAAAALDVPVAPRNPGMPFEADWVEVRVNRSAVERRAATQRTGR